MAILDATIIESNSRPKNKILEEEIPNDRNKNEFINNSAYAQKFESIFQRFFAIIY